MDINQSSLNQYKDARDIKRSKSEVRPSASINKTSTTASSNSALKQFNLKDGQIIKGRIIDQRYNEVRIQLEPGNQVVSAKLSGDVALSIGQEASFQVNGNNPDQLTLRYLPPEGQSLTDATVMKALSASGLAPTNLNKTIISELLSHRMGVDKQTIQLIMKAALQNREASPLSLVLMLKSNIPLTKENIQQFVSHQNGTAKLMNDINIVTKNISELLFPNDGIEPTSVNANPNILTRALDINGNLINILYQNHNSNVEGMSTNSTVNQLTPEEQTLINNILKQFSGNAGIPTVSTQSFPSNINALFQQISDGSFTQESVGQLMKLLPDGTDSSIGPLINKLITTIQNSTDNASLSTVLKPQERAALLDSLSLSSLGQEIKDQIKSGTLPVKRFLQEVQQLLTTTDNKALLRLLHTPEYTKVLENAFMQKWTLTSDQLAQKAPVNELYQNLQDDVTQLHKLLEMDYTTPEKLQTGETLKNLSDNLQFMKQLNEAYTYLQLPMQLKDQQMHSELYVFTNKRALKDNPNRLSVLLHLDMNHLGSLNVHIQMNQNHIQANFSLEDKEGYEIIQKNIPLLEKVLQEKGYIFHSKVERDYAKPDFVKDFIEESSSDITTQRYTFDIRT